MDDDSDNIGGRPRAGRADGRGETGSGRSGATGARAARRRPRVWERPVFWLGLIAVEVVIALVVANVGSGPIELTGEQRIAFCARMADVSAVQTDGPLDVAAAEGLFQQRRSALLSAAEVAPGNLQDDLGRLAEEQADLARRARELAESGGVDAAAQLASAMDESGQRSASAEQRVVDVVTTQCGGVGVPGTTAPGGAGTTGSDGAGGTGMPDGSGDRPGSTAVAGSG